MTAFGLLSLADHLPDPETGQLSTQADRFRLIVEAAVHAEQAGFDHVGVGEHHFGHYILPSPFLLLGAIAAKTQRIRLGTSVTLLASLDPVRVAEDLALLDVVATMPFAVAGTILGIGLIISFNSGWLVLTGGWFILVLAYVVRKVPFSVRTSSAILHQIDPSLEEASINLGVSPAMTFLRLTVPLMLGGIVGGMVLTWVSAASELSSTVLLYSGQWQTLTVKMFQALESTGAGLAAATASMLIFFTIVPIALIYRLLRRYEMSLL